MQDYEWIVNADDTTAQTKQQRPSIMLLGVVPLHEFAPIHWYFAPMTLLTANPRFCLVPNSGEEQKIDHVATKNIQE